MACTQTPGAPDGSHLIVKKRKNNVRLLSSSPAIRCDTRTWRPSTCPVVGLQHLQAIRICCGWKHLLASPELSILVPGRGALLPRFGDQGQEPSRACPVSVDTAARPRHTCPDTRRKPEVHGNTRRLTREGSAKQHSIYSSSYISLVTSDGSHLNHAP